MVRQACATCAHWTLESVCCHVYELAKTAGRFLGRDWVDVAYTEMCPGVAV